MNDHFPQDNIIQWIFEKAFNRLVIENKNIYKISFDKIKEKTFHNPKFAEMISKLNNRSLDTICSYLRNKDFIKKILFQNLKNKLNVSILINDIDWFHTLINVGHKPDSYSLKLAIVNNRSEIFEYLITIIKPTTKHLMYCAKYGRDEFYFKLIEIGIVPNLSVYNKAILGESINIIKHISQNIGLSKQILENAFETNNTEIILELVKISFDEKIIFPYKLITYPILNNNLNLLKKLEEMNLVKLEYELFYSAILSGSLDMLHYLEEKIPKIHNTKILDMSKTGKGQASLLLEDIVYQRNGKKYLSHTMNYAVQSGSISMVKYIYDLDYGITISNIITSIRQSSIEICEFLLKNYSGHLPHYLIYYFGFNSYIPNKLEKVKLFMDKGILNFSSRKSINEYKKETAHIELITQSQQIIAENVLDIDYLMNYQILIPNKNWLITAVRICVQLNLDTELEKILGKIIYDDDKQAVIDVIYLFGNLEQFIRYNPKKIAPSPSIIMESMCYHQIDKLIFLKERNMINGFQPEKLALMLGDSILQKIFNIDENDFSSIIISGNKEKIIAYLEKTANHNFITTEIAKKLLMTDNIEIIRKCDFSHLNLDLLDDFLINNDLLEIYNAHCIH